jgi:hypothetical protein
VGDEVEPVQLEPARACAVDQRRRTIIGHREAGRRHVPVGLRATVRREQARASLAGGHEQPDRQQNRL